jgi:hypothetical protein
MMTTQEWETLAATINALSRTITEGRRLLTEDTIIQLLAAHTRVGAKTIRRVLRGLEQLPEHTLTPVGRAIRFRDFDRPSWPSG